MPAIYRRLTFVVPRELEDVFTAELWAHGALGCEIRDADGPRGRLHVDVYLPHPLPAPCLAPELGEWRSRGVELAEDVRFAERDWQEEFRAAARPVEVGSRFLVDPRDAQPSSALEAPPERTLLRVPARTAFGTGSHESTRLVVEWLEELDVRGQDVLDVGTGSGILAFAALHLGARRVVGFDLDAPATLIARQNGELNLLRPLFFAGRLAALRARPAFDVALVNVLPERILGELPRLLAVLRPGARVVSSGNLWSRREELRRKLRSRGLTPAGEKRAGEWVSFLLR